MFQTRIRLKTREINKFRHRACVQRVKRFWGKSPISAGVQNEFWGLFPKSWIEVRSRFAEFDLQRADFFSELSSNGPSIRVPDEWHVTS